MSIPAIDGAAEGLADSEGAGDGFADLEGTEDGAADFEGVVEGVRLGNLVGVLVGFLVGVLVGSFSETGALVGDGVSYNSQSGAFSVMVTG